MAIAIGQRENCAAVTTSKEPIRIGVLTSMTGDYSPIGFYATKGVQMAVDSINQAGGRRRD